MKLTLSSVLLGIVFYTFLFFISFHLQSKETKQNPTYTDMISALNQFCRECSTPSKAAYKKALIQLEGYVEAHQNSYYFEKSNSELLSAYTNYILGFCANDSTETKVYIEKLSGVVFSKMRVLGRPYQGNQSFPSDIEKHFIDALINQEINEEILSQYQNFLISIDDQKNKIRQENIRGTYYNDFTGFNRTKIWRSLNIEKKEMFKKRVGLSLLMPGDVELIEKYIKVINNGNYNQPNSQFSLRDLLDVIFHYISNNRVNQARLKSIRRAIILASQKTYRVEKYDDILWWTEAWRDNDLEQQQNFLISQLNTPRQDDAIEVLISTGRVKTLQKIHIESQNASDNIIFKLALRRAKSQQVIERKNTPVAKIIVKEYKSSMDDIIENHLPGLSSLWSSTTPNVAEDKLDELDQAYKQHFRWLMKQLAQTIDQTNTQKTIRHLAENSLYYNQPLTQKLNTNQKEKLQQLLNDKLNIASTIQFIDYYLP